MAQAPAPMPAWAVSNFGGMIPRTGSRNLATNMAEQATNCDLSSGYIEALPTPELLHDFNALGAPLPQRAYRLPAPNSTDPDAWLPLPSPYSSVVRSPLTNDTFHRLYWTSPGVPPLWNTYARIIAGQAPYNLGTIQPDLTAPPLSYASTGGTSLVQVVRSYCYTWVNEYGEESAPNLPGAAVSGNVDGVWLITGIPEFGPANPPGKHYPVITHINLYRTSTGTNTGAQFYLVKQFTFPAPSIFTDTILDVDIVNNLPLPSASWTNPLDIIDGLVALPGGMLAAFSDNTVHFCEPDRPHTWPAAYDQSLSHDIVGLAVWQQSLVVMTQGFPATGAGNSPSNYIFTQVRVPEPCIARGSIITDLMGVYYASQNGLVMLNYFGMQNQTLSLFTKNIWLRDYHAADIIACRHRSQYLATTGNSGFLIDYAEARLGVMPLSSFKNTSCVWNDDYTGDAYIMASGRVYRWDSPNTGPLVYRWRSKQFYGQAPISLGACQVSLDPAIATTRQGVDPLFSDDPTLMLPADAAAVFNLYAGPDGEHLVLSRPLRNPREIFRLPSGFKAFDWQFEIVGCVGLRGVEVARTMRELSGV